MTRQSVGALLATAILLLLPLVLALGFADVAAWLQELARQAMQYSPWLLLGRASLGLLLIAGWSAWVELLARHYRWSAAQRRFVLNQRWRVAAWLLVLELLLGQGVLAGCYRLLS